MNRTKSALSLLAVAGVLTLMGCSSDSDGATATTSTAPATTAEVTTTEAPETTLPAAETTVTAAGPADTTPVTVVEEPTTSKITVTVAGTDTVINPDAVYCSGAEGNVRHIIGKTNNQPPLVEATPGEFAMVKLDQRGAPYKSDKPVGITFGAKSATFDNVTLGGATVNGSLVCTQFED